MPKAPKTEEVAPEEVVVAADEAVATTPVDDDAPYGAGCSPEYLRWQK